MPLQPTKFSIDTISDVLLDGFSSGETWNGWDCPYFTFEQAQKVIEAFNTSQQIGGENVKARYDTEQDAFCFFFESSGESEDFPAEEIDGQKYYPIGAGCWIWERAGKWDNAN
jgi:hypothetical protein